MAEVYRVGIAIVMTSNASQVLGVIGRDIMGLGRQADALSSKLDHVRMAARGAMAAIGGAAVLHGMAVAVNPGKDLVQQQNRMKQVGMSQADIAHATAEAWRETCAVVNRGVTENLALIQGLRKAIGDMGQGIKLSPTASRFEPALASITGNRTEGQGRTSSVSFSFAGHSLTARPARSTSTKRSSGRGSARRSPPSRTVTVPT